MRLTAACIGRRQRENGESCVEHTRGRHIASRVALSVWAIGGDVMGRVPADLTSVACAPLESSVVSGIGPSHRACGVCTAVWTHRRTPHVSSEEIQFFVRRDNVCVGFGLDPPVLWTQFSAFKIRQECLFACVLSCVEISTRMLTPKSVNPFSSAKFRRPPARVQKYRVSFDAHFPSSAAADTAAPHNAKHDAALS